MRQIWRMRHRLANPAVDTKVSVKALLISLRVRYIFKT